MREMMFNASKCTLCGRCKAACPVGAHAFDDGKHIYNRELCTLCGKCEDKCFVSALEVAGSKMSASDVIGEVMKDKIFYDNSGGGITLSGGEPLLQADFSYEILRLAKEKSLHTCMETCGFAPWEKLKKLAPLVDIFLFDYKETDCARHKEYTGVSNELILDNLKKLDEMGKSIILRCPIIPTLNDRDEHFKGIADVANSLKNVLEINVEPYHPLGAGKCEQLGKEYPLSDLGFPEDATVAKWIEKIKVHTPIDVKKA
jgi:pyruvate formate lyase activating enzyme